MIIKFNFSFSLKFKNSPKKSLTKISPKIIFEPQNIAKHEKKNMSSEIVEKLENLEVVEQEKARNR